jgi:hypothetical protein
MRGDQEQPLRKRSMFRSPLPTLDFHPLTAGGVLSLEGSRRIWVVNDTSAFVWRILDEVSSLEELAYRLTAEFSISKETALRDAEAALASFAREGLLPDGRRLEVPEHEDNWDLDPRGPSLVEPGAWAVTQSFRVADHVFEFRCVEAALGEAFVSCMSHLEVEDELSSHSRLAVLCGRADPQTCDIYIDGVGFKEALPKNMVLPHLVTVLFVRCCEALKERLLFHAAVIAGGGRAAIFPGEAGSGKTTLAVALMARGYRVFSDELAVLNVESLCVSPLPLPMSIKSGSAEPLSRLYPGLADSAIHLRSDGKKVRYLSPTAIGRTGTADGSAPLAVLVFPMYIKGAINRLVAVDQVEVLRRLAKAGSSNRDLTRRDVDAMVSLAKTRPCYEFIFGDVCRAAAFLEEHVLSRHLRPD